MLEIQTDQIFEDIVDTIREPLLVLDSDLKVISASRSFYGFFKVSPEETVGQLIYDLGNRQWDIPGLRELLETILPQKTTFDDYEVEHNFTSIGRRIMLLNARQIERALGKERIILLAIEDITGRRQLETLLEDSEERFRRLFETANDGILLLEKKEGKIIQVNPSIITMLGYSNDELIGKRLHDVGFPNEIGTIQKILNILEKNGIIHHKDAQVQKKTRQVVDTDIYMVDKAALVQCNVRDITERKRTEKLAEEALLSKTILLEAQSETSLDGILAVDKNRHAILFNKRFGELWRIPRHVLDMKDDADILKYILKQLKDPDEFERLVAYIYEHKDVKSRDEIEFIDGRYFDRYSSPLLSPDGKYLGRIWFFRDITAQKKAVKSLRESETRFKALFQESPVSITVHDKDTGKIVDANEAALTAYGFTSLEELKTNEFWADPPYSFNEALAWINKAAAKGFQSFEWKNRRVTGETFWSQVYLRFLMINNLGRILATSIDITDRKKADDEKEKLQTQLMQARKMESVGRLAGGVAHDFNNMLSVIIGNAELAMEDIAPDDPLHNTLSEILSAARHSADITRQLLAFARKQAIAPKVLDLNETIKGILKMLRRLIGEDIDLAWLPNAKACPVWVDPSQIDQILANLCVNARDAIADVGKVTVETGIVTIDAAYCEDNPGFIPGDFVLLAVSDNGCGMDRETLDQLFEPFFTTKEKDKGTGLGLAMVYGIVKQNNGFINVYSEPEKGTTFKIFLPCHETAEEKIRRGDPLGPDARGSETILLVEDEQSILRITRIMLEKLGYTVLAAAAPGEAIELARVHAGDIDLLITDVVMPEMNGHDLAVKLLSIYPNLRCLFMSGYTADVIAHHGVLDEGVHFIQKPFARQDLATRVRDVLDEKGGSSTLLAHVI